MTDHSGTCRLLSLAVIACVGFNAAPARAQEHTVFLEVSKSADGFTVEAEDATLPQLLAAIGAKAGFSVQDSGAQRPPIPVFEVRDASLESTLRQLLGTSNHLIVYRGGSQGKIVDGGVEKVVLLSPGKRERVADRPISSLAGPPGAVAPPARANRAASTDEAPTAIELGDTKDFDAEAEAQEQLVYGESLQDMEQQMIDQLGVDTDGVAAGAPGVPPPGLPPDVLKRLEEYAGGDEAALPPDVVAPRE